MDFTLLQQTSFTDLKKMAKNMGLPSKRSSTDYISEIKKALTEYANYKHNKLDKYVKIRQLGSKGKEGITYLVKDKNGNNFAMKTFRKKKSSATLLLEYNLQKKAGSANVAPRTIEYDTVSKYIVMEKMDIHMIDLMEKQKKKLLRWQQFQIINLFKKLDNIGIFHGDSNILNYMLKDKKIYLIDFGFAKEITPKLCEKLGTTSPNLKIMTLGLVLKLKELRCYSSSWKYLKKYINNEDIRTFGIE